MSKHMIYPIGSTAASRYAATFLEQAGLEIVDHPTPEVTHLLLDVPGFGADGQLRGGGSVEKILEMLPHYITVVGGNLDHPTLDGYRKLDLLQDADYVAENAAITADCALQAASPLLSTTLQHSPALIIGWGRIGKCLGKLLKAIGTDITIAVRKPTDQAMLRALGYRAIDTMAITETLSHYRLIFNTAPEMILDQTQLSFCKNCVKIDLASRQGLEGEDVVWARGLPGVYAPETSGRLIANTFIRLLKEES